MMKKFLLLALILIFSNYSFSDDFSKERVKMLEEQAVSVGVNKIDTYKKVFAFHDAVYKAIGDRSGIYPDFYGLSFKTSIFHSFVLNNQDPYMILDQNPGENYYFSIPVIYDYCVMISRMSEKLEITNDIQNKICASFKSDIITGDWCKEYGITQFDRDNFLGSSAFQKVVDGQADFIFMPRRLALVIIDMMGYTEDLYVSRPIFEISYRFAFPKEKREDCEELNSIIFNMINSGELAEICHKFNVSQSLNPPKNIQKELLFHVIIFLLVISIFNILFTINCYRKDISNNKLRELYERFFQK